MEKEEFLEMIIEKVVEVLEDLNEELEKLKVDVDKLVKNIK